MSKFFHLILLPLFFSFTLSMSASASPWHAAGRNTAGWQFMTPDERIEHQRRMRGFETFEQCIIYQNEHHALMEQRAQKAGIALQRKLESGCTQLQKKGKFK